MGRSGAARPPRPRDGPQGAPVMRHREVRGGKGVAPEVAAVGGLMGNRLPGRGI